MNATLTLSEAADRLWGVAVVGAGPSGTLAARALAQRGHAVILLDKSEFPRRKVCGGCINQRAQHALAAAGLGDLLESLGAAKIDSLNLGSSSRAALIPIPGYVAITRESLDNALLTEAIDSGVNMLMKTRARSTHVTNNVRVLQVDQGDIEAAIRARIVVAADGLGSALANDAHDVASNSRIGAGAIAREVPVFFEPGRIHMACGSGGYVGLTRVEDGFVDIAAAFDPSYIREKGGLGEAAAAIFEQAGFPVWPEFAQLDWRGTPALTRRNTKVASERMYVVGDAAGYVEPFTGEGIAWAFTTGLAVADYVSDAIHESNRSIEIAWTKRHKQIVTGRQYLCHAISHALRHPRVVTTAVRVLQRIPALAQPLISGMNTPAPIRRKT